MEALVRPAHAGPWSIWNERQEKDRILKMEFKSFVDRFIRIPCQIIRKGRQLIYLVSTSPDLSVFFRAVGALEQPLPQ